MINAPKAFSSRSPLLWLVLLLISYNTYTTFSSDRLQSVVRSDGRGYYAYLPAIFIYGDNSYSSVIEAEKKYHPGGYEQQFVNRTEHGNSINKYFPGTALLQLPFFLIAQLLAWMFNLPADGYSNVFMILAFIGNTFYSVAGILLIRKVINRIFEGSEQNNDRMLSLLVICGPVICYCFLDQVYSQHISFFLFALTAFLFMNYIRSSKGTTLIFLGISFGLIFLVRPTNLSFILFLPVLLTSKQELTMLLKQIFGKHLKHFFIAIAAFLFVCSILLFVWKWQTGQWIVWSYSGEGFYFLNPQVWSVLFSFRSGIFLQVPVFFMIVFAVIYTWRTESYRLFWWMIYLVVTIWIIASWWCWDFETQFSVRPLAEHFIFLALPLFFLLKKKMKLVFSALIVFGILGIIRLVELETGFMGNQRFTSDNYFKSLVFWRSENFARWNFNLSCKPYGRLEDSQLLKEELNSRPILHETEFSHTGEAFIKNVNRKGRMYYVVTFDKQFSDGRMKDVFLVIDAVSNDGSKRWYQSVDLFADAYEGKKDWASLRFEGLIPDYFSEYDKVTIYIWNPGKMKLKVRNYKAVLETYTN